MGVPNRIALAAAAFLFCVSLLNAAVPPGYTGKVFTGDTLNGHPQAIPGVVKAVFFDEGGPEVGFHDTWSVNFGTIRLDSADKHVGMQPFGSGDRNADGSVPPQGSYHLSWIDVGEWIRCTVHVMTAGQYDVTTYEAVSATPNSQSVSFNDGTPIPISNLAPTTAPAGNEIWHNWNTFNNVATVNLDTGLFVLKLTFVTNSFNCDKLMFTLKNGTGLVSGSIGHNACFSFALRTRSEKNRLAVSYVLPQAGKTSLSIVNYNGRTVSLLQERLLSAGAHAETVPLAGLCPGVYFLELKLNGISEESKFIITR